MAKELFYSKTEERIVPTMSLHISLKNHFVIEIEGPKFLTPNPFTEHILFLQHPVSICFLYREEPPS
jgi:hypothetical protein